MEDDPNGYDPSTMGAIIYGYTQTQDDTSEVGDVGDEFKCCRRGCDLGQGGLLGTCACGRNIHVECVEFVYIAGKKLNPLPVGVVACTKRCYDKYKATAN